MRAKAAARAAGNTHLTAPLPSAAAAAQAAAEVEAATGGRGGGGSAQQTYALADLQRQPFPDGVDAAAREEFLSDEDFAATFGMDKATFKALPQGKGRRPRRSMVCSNAIACARLAARQPPGPRTRRDGGKAIINRRRRASCTVNILSQLCDRLYLWILYIFLRPKSCSRKFYLMAEIFEGRIPVRFDSFDSFDLILVCTAVRPHAIGSPTVPKGLPAYWYWYGIEYRSSYR